MSNLINGLRRSLCRWLGCAEAPLEPEPKRNREPINVALSEADLTKLLDSARAEIRSYQALYLSLFGVSLLVVTIILRVPLWDHTTTTVRALLIAPWLLGVAILLFGVHSITPRFKPGSGKADDFLVLKNIEQGLLTTEPETAKWFLVEAIRITLRIQRNVAEAKKFFRSGVLIVVLAVVMAVLASISLSKPAENTDGKETGKQGAISTEVKK